jgi:hypothetical protein
VEFSFAQFSPAVCLPCKQTDLVQQIIALFRVLLYRILKKTCSKSKIQGQINPIWNLQFHLTCIFNCLILLATTFANWQLLLQKVIIELPLFDQEGGLYAKTIILT